MPANVDLGDSALLVIKVPLEVVLAGDGRSHGENGSVELLADQAKVQDTLTLLSTEAEDVGKDVHQPWQSED